MSSVLWEGDTLWRLWALAGTETSPLNFQLCRIERHSNICIWTWTPISRWVCSRWLTVKTLGEDLEGPAGQGPATAGTLQGDCKAPSTVRLNFDFDSVFDLDSDLEGRQTIETCCCYCIAILWRAFFNLIICNMLSCPRWCTAQVLHHIPRCEENVCGLEEKIIRPLIFAIFYTTAQMAFHSIF